MDSCVEGGGRGARRGRVMGSLALLLGAGACGGTGAPGPGDERAAEVENADAVGVHGGSAPAAGPPEGDHAGHDHGSGDHQGDGQGDGSGDHQGDGHGDGSGQHKKPRGPHPSGLPVPEGLLVPLAPVADPALGLQPYPVPLPDWMEPPPVPADNALTHAGVDLGRRLFYDPLLSGGNTMSCAGCHQQSRSFTDGKAVSVGEAGRPLARNAMPLVNLAWTAPYFWDGRAPTLEALVPIPIQHPDEMNQPMPALLDELGAHPDYPARFAAAFPGEGITEATVSKAIAQFLRTLVSFNSRADLLDEGLTELSPLERRGNELMVAGLPKGAPDRVQDICDACHKHSAGVINADSAMGLFTTAAYKTNGLDAGDDRGRAAVTGDAADQGAFKIPSIRNLTHTAPYMHDGRFATVEEVVAHYNEGIADLPNLEHPLRLSGRVARMELSAEDQAAVVAMLGIFTDASFLTNPAFSDPFAAPAAPGD